MTKHLMLDLETVGILPNSVVLSIGCLPFSFEEPKSFDEYLEDGFFCKLDVEDQIRNYGRKIDKDTLDWWKQQSPEARVSLKPSKTDIPLAEALRGLDAFIRSCKLSDESWFWSRGNLFDFGKIESMCNNVGMPMPHNPFMERDVRTMVDCFAGTTNGKIKVHLPSNFVSHHPLHDCAKDVMMMTNIYQSMMNE